MMVLGGMFMMAGCSDDNEPVTEEPGTEKPAAKVTIQFTYETLTVEAAGGETEMGYTLKNAGTNPKLTGTCNEDWITDIQGADGTLKMTVAPNPETTERTATVTVTYSDDEENTASAELTVTQAAKAEEQFAITITGKAGSTYVPFKITPKDMAANYFINCRPVDEMEGFVSDEALYNSDMSLYQQYADQNGVSLGEFLQLVGALANGELENNYVLLSPSTDYCLYCYAVENGELASPVSKVTFTTPAPAPVDNQITISVLNNDPDATSFSISTTTPDAYVMAIFDGEEYTDAQIENALPQLSDDYLSAGSAEEIPMNGALEANHEYAVAAMGRAGNTMTTKAFITRFTTSDRVELQLDLTTLAFDGDELASYMENPDIAGDPWIFHHIVTNGKYTLTLAASKEELDQIRASYEAQVGKPVSDDQFYYELIIANLPYTSMNSDCWYQVTEGETLRVVTLASKDTNLTYSVSKSTVIEVTEENYSPVEELGKYQSRSTASTSLKKPVHLDVKATVAAMKKIAEKHRSTSPMKLSVPAFRSWK